MKKAVICLLLFQSFYLISCGDKNDQKKISLKKSGQTEQSVANDEIKDNAKTDNQVSGGQSQGNNSSKAKITSREVIDHIGDSLTIKGYVADVYVSEKVSYLNFENKFPKNTFSCAIFSKQADSFGDISKYKGKVVEVSGKINTYKGKPQVILNSPEQIKIIK